MPLRHPVKREIVRSDKTPNNRYHHQVGFIVGEDMVGADSGEIYVTVVWLTKPSVTGDKRQTMSRKHLTVIGFEDPHSIILETPEWQTLLQG